MKETTLSVVVSGDLSVESNIDEYKAYYLEKIKEADKPLVTDQDFADAADVVKYLDGAEKKIDGLIADVLSQSKDVHTITSALEELKEESKNSRISLKKQIDAKKSEVKGNIKTQAMSELSAKVGVLIGSYPFLQGADLGFNAPERIDKAMHRLSSLDSMAKAVDDVTQTILAEVEAYHTQFEQNKALIESIDKKYIPAFQDHERLMMFEPDKLKMEIAARVARCEAEEAKLKLEEKEKADLQEQMAAIKEPDTPPVEEPAPVEEPPTPTPVEPDTPPSEDRELLVIVRFYGPIEKARALQMLLDPDQLKEAFKDYSPASNILSGIVGKPFLTSPEKLKQRYLNDQ